VLELLLITGLLRTELEQLALRVYQGCLFVLKCESFIIENSIKVINASKCLRDIVFNGSDLGSIFNTFLALRFDLSIKFVNFISILSVAFSQVLQVFIELFLLIKKRGI
jgi:hypothetical protein